MRKILVFFLIITGIVFSQDLEKYYSKIEKKIKFDENYLDIYTISWYPKQSELSELKDFPRLNGEKMNFVLNDKVEYKFYFILETIEINELTLLQIERITAPTIGKTLLPGQNIPQPKVDIVYAFGDFNELYYAERDKYNSLQDHLKYLLTKGTPTSELAVVTDEKKRSRGISSANNQDYLNYMWVNNRHMYPSDPAQASTKRLSRREKAKIQAGSDFMIDATPYSVSFYHKEMNFEFSILSAELSLDSELLNLHPFQSNALRAGIRSLVFLSQDSKNMKDDYIIDLRLMGRIGLNTSSIVSSLPFVFAEDAKLNVGSGFIFDIKTTRVVDLPFINLYFAAGSENVENPGVSFGHADSSYAYFTFGEFAATMSFFWNASEKRNLRFRMDVGFGGYDVVKATYFRGTNSKTIFNSILPLVDFSFNFVPQSRRGSRNNELFAARVKLFDNVIKADFWMKLLELEEGLHTFRFEAGFISNPFYRSRHEWETDSSTKIGIRYRYGFN